jgi:peptidoglycan/LPS O-acetylase OafA/YrhL
MMVGKNSDIQILRAIAVSAVVVHHAFGNLFVEYPNWIEGYLHYFNGGAGVDLFFVISGYVIGLSFLPSMSDSAPYTKSQAIKSFWIRRVFRIFPLAWFWLFFLLIASMFFNTSGAFGSIEANIDGTIYALLQIANYRFEQCFMKYECGPSFVYWSLSLEEQFYFFLPIVVLLFRRYTFHFLLVILVYKLMSESLAYHFAFRFEGIVLGVLLSQCAHKSFYIALGAKLSLVPRWLVICFAYILLVLTFFVSSREIYGLLGGWGFKVAAILSFIVVWLASYDENYIFSSAYRIKDIFLWVGERSFALYLIHIPAFLLIRELGFNMSGSQKIDSVITTTFLAVVVLVVFSELSYRMIENPMRLIGIKISKKILSSS